MNSDPESVERRRRIETSRDIKKEIFCSFMSIGMLILAGCGRDRFTTVKETVVASGAAYRSSLKYPRTESLFTSPMAMAPNALPTIWYTNIPMWTPSPRAAVMTDTADEKKAMLDYTNHLEFKLER